MDLNFENIPLHYKILKKKVLTPEVFLCRKPTCLLIIWENFGTILSSCLWGNILNWPWLKRVSLYPEDFILCGYISEQTSCEVYRLYSQGIGTRDLPFCIMFRLALWSNQQAVQWVSRALSLWLAALLHLVLRLRMSGARPPLPRMPSWCVHRDAGQGDLCQIVLMMEGCPLSYFLPDEGRVPCVILFSQRRRAVLPDFSSWCRRAALCQTKQAFFIIFFAVIAYKMLGLCAVTCFLELW
jgi:hypothetical protein